MASMPVPSNPPPFRHIRLAMPRHHSAGLQTFSGCSLYSANTMTDDPDRPPPAFMRFLLLSLACWAGLVALAFWAFWAFWPF